MNAFNLKPLIFDLAIAATALIVFAADLVSERAKRYTGQLTALLLAAILAASFWIDASGTTAFGAYVGGAAATYLTRIVLVVAIIGALGGLGQVREQTPLRQGEYYFLLLLSVLGMCLLPGARDLILLVVCFELMGIPLYVLAAFAKTDRLPSSTAPSGAASEAGIKLYLVGAASTALMLFGVSILAGLAGGTSFAAVATVPESPLLLVGMLFILAGMGFKLGVAPFHMWVPDTYEGASTPFVAFLSAAPKVAGMAAVTLVFVTALSAQQHVWAPAVLVLCPITLLVGSLLALPQTNVKRLLAYSGVAHIGFMLMAFAVGSALSVQMLLFYLLAYAITNAGVFLVVHAVCGPAGDDSKPSFDGLAQRSPWLALALLVFLLSLAGIPFVAGFWAKLYIFMVVYRAGHVGLVVLAALISVLALFYYLQLVKCAYINAPVHAEPIRVSKSLTLAIALCLAGVIGIGIWPSPFLSAAERAAAPLVAARSPAAPSQLDAPRLSSLEH